MPPPRDDLLEAFVDARVEAQRLALDGGDEVAALFYACAARSPSIGEDFVMAMLVMLNHGAASGRRATVDARALSRELILRSREIAGGVLTFEAFRAWLALHLAEVPK